jgi:hypothetical protein
MIALSAQQELQDRGYVVLPALIPPDQIARLNARIEELFALEGESAGSEFKTEPGACRIANAALQMQHMIIAVAAPAAGRFPPAP